MSASSLCNVESVAWEKTSMLAIGRVEEMCQQAARTLHHLRTIHRSDRTSPDPTRFDQGKQRAVVLRNDQRQQQLSLLSTTASSFEYKYQSKIGGTIKERG